MGTRIEYWGKAETDCAHCGNSIVIEHNFTEYPVGDFEDGEIQLSGASRIEHA
ncbi:hypothetical protein [Endozoicomonas acroporae]|uniref:hypothetical protein n=1 Tax=Endozoicomonas acroporae TaxID=1701104 RepID=UPI003D7ADEA3